MLILGTISQFLASCQTGQVEIYFNFGPCPLQRPSPMDPQFIACQNLPLACHVLLHTLFLENDSMSNFNVYSVPYPE